MNKFKWWLFRQLVRTIVSQSGHWLNTLRAMSIIREEWVTQFNEDNRFTHDSCLLEIFRHSLKR